MDALASACCPASLGIDHLAQLTNALADVPPAQLTAGSILATATSVLADIDGDLPGEPIHTITTRVRAAISNVLGAAAIATTPGPPHLALAYGTAAGDSGTLQSRLRRQLRPSHAPITIRSVYLVDVTQDAHLTQYTWNEIARVPLATDDDQR